MQTFKNGTDTPYLLAGDGVVRYHQLVLLRYPKYYIRCIVEVEHRILQSSGGCGCGFSGRDAMMSPEDLLRKLSGVGFEEAEHEIVSILCGDSVSRRSRSGINSAREPSPGWKNKHAGNKFFMKLDYG
ncbi:hypothetical protein Tco_0939329 [Tanacetum coccineum]|uniref:Uncharacterized protein n=1 Tax=Tanacetum coccineum TaxID=301880 RepID=A0ABQ5DQW7_9ASTR